MRISQANSKAKELDVDFDGATLHVEYRPLSYTIKQMRQLADNKDPVVIADTIKRLVLSWDLDDNDGARVPLDFERAEDGAVSEDDPLLEIPSNIFTGILQAVQKDQTVSGEAGRPSGAS